MLVLVLVLVRQIVARVRFPDGENNSAACRASKRRLEGWEDAIEDLFLIIIAIQNTIEFI